MEILKNTSWLYILLFAGFGIGYLIYLLKGKDENSYNLIKGYGAVILCLFFVLIAIIAKLFW